MRNGSLYLDEADQPIMRPSFFAFVDILGFADRLTEAHEAGNEQALFDSLLRALAEARESVDSRAATALGPRRGPLLWEYKFFTDNLVIGYPLGRPLDQGEVELGTLLMVLTDYQFGMAMRGFFLRGACAFGHVHTGQDLVFGAPLVEAYRLEKSDASWPRILMSEDVMTWVKHHLSFYRDPKQAPQNFHVAIDEDDRPFLNYLEAAWPDDDVILWGEMAKHRDAIVCALTANEGKPQVTNKLLRAAGYHNWFCRTLTWHPEYKDEVLVAGVGPAAIRRLVVG